MKWLCGKEAMTAIEWTDVTWNPMRGCRRVSRGCERCYAERFAYRFSGPGQPNEGLVKKTSQGARWTGELQFVESRLRLPLTWSKPQAVFVNSMSDVFYGTDAMIACVFAIMALSRKHTFCVLTKRPVRMAEFCGDIMATWRPTLRTAAYAIGVDVGKRWDAEVANLTYPLRNVELGVSAEDQGTASDRIEVLANTPAAVRVVSLEPLLGPVDLGSVRGASSLDWVIVGGESGPGARPCEVDWIKTVVRQTRTLHVPVFVKQLGSNPIGCADSIRGKGADMSEWPDDIAIREFSSLRSGGDQ